MICHTDSFHTFGETDYILAFWETCACNEKRTLLRGLDLHHVFSALWALREFSISSGHALLLRRFLLNSPSSTTTSRVISGDPCVKRHLRLSAASLTHFLNKEFSHLSDIFLDSMKYSLHFLDAFTEHDVLGFSTLGNQLHIIFHLGS